MAEHMSKAAVSGAIQAGLAAGMLMLASLAAAEGLADPTRPPASLGVVRDLESNDAAGGPALQSVLISPTRRVAVINGETVKEGGKVGDLRVARISEDEVVLRNGSDVKVLKLYPSIEKKRPESSRPKAEALGRRQ